MAKFLDSNGLLYLWSKIMTALGNKVDKESGKTLSANDLTNELKANYDSAYDFSKNAQIPTISTDIAADAQSDAKAASPKAVKTYVDTAVGDVDMSTLLEKNGDGSAVTVAFSAAESFADINSGESLASVLGKLKKWFAMRAAANGFATLDASGVIPSNQLPGYVDDVIELTAISDDAPVSELVDGCCYFSPAENLIYTYSGGEWGVGEAPDRGKIYIDISSGISYRWGGSVMVKITSSDLSPLSNEEIDSILSA